MEASLSRPEEGDVVASARGVLFQSEPARPSAWRVSDTPLPAPETLRQTSFLPKEYAKRVPPGFHRSIQLRITRSEDRPIAWITTPLDLVAGEAMTPLERLAAICDLTFGVGSHLWPREPIEGEPPGMLINTDTSIHLERVPVGPWIAFSQGAIADHEGIGQASVTVSDEQGRVGRSLQSLIAN